MLEQICLALSAFSRLDDRSVKKLADPDKIWRKVSVKYNYFTVFPTIRSFGSVKTTCFNYIFNRTQALARNLQGLLRGSEGNDLSSQKF